MVDIVNYSVLNKNYTFFRTFIFAWLLWRKWIEKASQPPIFELSHQTPQSKKATHQPEDFVNQNVDINEGRRRRIFLINF